MIKVFRLHPWFSRTCHMCHMCWVSIVKRKQSSPQNIFIELFRLQSVRIAYCLFTSCLPFLSIEYCLKIFICCLLSFYTFSTFHILPRSREAHLNLVHYEKSKSVRMWQVHILFSWVVKRLGFSVRKSSVFSFRRLNSLSMTFYFLYTLNFYNL